MANDIGAASDLIGGSVAKPDTPSLSSSGKPAPIDPVALAQGLVDRGKLSVDQANEMLAQHGVTDRKIAEPVKVDTLDPLTKQNRVATADLIKARENWIKAGHDVARFDEALKADGYELPANDETPEQQEVNAEFDFDKDHPPSDYKINYMAASEGKTIDVAGLAQFNAEAQQFLSSISINRGLGASLVERCMADAQAYNQMSDSAKELYRREQRYIAQKHLGGEEQLNAAIVRAGKVLRQDTTTFSRRLLESGALHSAWSLITLANEGARLEQWSAKYPAKKK